MATALPFPYTLTGMIQSYFAHLVDVRMWWANAIQLEWQRRLLIQQEYTKAMTVQNSVCSDALLHFCTDGGLRWGHVQIEVWGTEATCWRGKVKEICFADRSVWGEDVETCTCKRMISISCFFQLRRNYMQTARTIRSKDLFCLEVTDQWTGLLATGSTAYSSFSNLFELFTLVRTAYCSIAAPQQIQSISLCPDQRGQRTWIFHRSTTKLLVCYLRQNWRSVSLSQSQMLRLISVDIHMLRLPY